MVAKKIRLWLFLSLVLGLLILGRELSSAKRQQLQFIFQTQAMQQWLSQKQIEAATQHAFLNPQHRVDCWLVPKIGWLRTIEAQGGYSGPIELMLFVHQDRLLGGVAILTSQETPGIGDWVDSKHSHWLDQFQQRGGDRDFPATWRVDQDGGTFDTRSGATVTPRAIVNAVAAAYTEEKNHPCWSVQRSLLGS